VSRRKTNEEKALSGTLQKCRVNHTEPPRVVGMPDIDLNMLTPRAREWLPKIATPLIEAGTLTVADGANLILLLEAWSQYIEAGELVEKAGGPIYETRTETGSIIYRPHPAAALRSEAHRRFTSLSARFGMTPADRLRVPSHLERPAAPNPWDTI
jgi:P27 family predicted phage terminase small subunit